MNTYPLIINGEQIKTPDSIQVLNKYTDEAFATVSKATEQDVQSAVSAAKRAFAEVSFDPFARYNVLMKAAELLMANRDELADIMIKEAGKLIGDAKNEVMWSADLLIESAEEAKRISGETVIFPIPGLDKKLCYTKREPCGIVCAISPFNFPLNLVVHKVAPALAAGNAVILKPATVTPIVAYRLCEILLEAGVPKGFLHYLTGDGKALGASLTSNPDISFYSFTGSVEVGKQVQSAIGLRRSAMELGSNSATIIAPDYDQKAAAVLCADNAFSNAGQVCISVQRVYVHKSHIDEVVIEMTRRAGEIIPGNPADSATLLGPMISEKEAIRAMDWIAQAKEGGATIHCGDKREGSLCWPTVITGATREMAIIRKEVFAPIVSVMPYETIEEAIEKVNDSDFGLQAGVLTNNISTGMLAADKIKTGGVIIGGVSSFRLGNMPYGGVKNSGIGREGPRHAIEEMTDLKTVVIL